MMILMNSKRTSNLFSVFLGVLMFLSANSIFASTITGIIFDKQRNPLPNVDVELQNDLYQQIGRRKTDGSGRYQFDGLSDGNYTVRVMPFLYDLMEQSQPIEIKTLTVRGPGIGNAIINTDFYLAPRKGGLAETELTVVFSQEIPTEAKKMYEKGINSLANKNIKDGVMELNEAIKIFPDYYLALMRIGKELFIMKKYNDAVPFFFKAANVNSKSATALYYLGSSLHNLGKDYNKSSLAALNQALVLAPASTQVLYVLGKVERDEGKYEEAEKHLLQAKKISKISVAEIHKELAQLYANNLKKYSQAADELELYLKASKLNDEEEKKTKKIISDLRSKSSSTSNNN